MSGNIRHFSTRFKQFAHVVRVIFVDSLWRFRGCSFFVLSCSLLGVSAQASAIGVAAYYAKALSKGITVTIFNYSFVARESALLLTGCGLWLLIAFLLSAVFNYISERKSFRLRFLYQEHCSKRILHCLAANFFVWSPSKTLPGDFKSLMRLVRGDCVFSGRVARSLVSLIVPAVSTFLALCTLFYQEFWLTFLMIFLLSISIFFLYLANIHASQQSRLVEQNSPLASLIFKHLLLELLERPVITDAHRQRLETLFQGSSLVNTYNRALFSRMHSAAIGKLVSNVFISLTMFIILVIMGGSILNGSRSAGGLLIYLGAVRIGLNNFRAVTTSLMGVSRFYPQVFRYWVFMDLFNQSPPKKIALPDSYQLRARRQDGQTSISLRKGMRVVAYCPANVNRCTVGHLVSMLVGRKRKLVGAILQTTWFVPLLRRLAEEPLLDQLAFPKGYPKEEIVNIFQYHANPGRILNALPDDLGEPISQEQWEAIPSEGRYALAMLAAAAGDSQWILLDEKELSAMDSNVRKDLLRKMQDRVVVIVSRNPDSAGDYGEDCYCLCDDLHLIGVGGRDWLEQKRETVMEVLLAGSKGSQDGPTDMDDEELEL